jgi:integrase/recombinase XerD
MLEDMKIRNLALNTQDSYLRQVSQFARHFGKSPDFLGQEEIRSYQIYLTQEPLPFSRAHTCLEFLGGCSLHAKG